MEKILNTGQIIFACKGTNIKKNKFNIEYKNSFEIYVDANYNFGLAIELIDLKTHYIKLKSNQIILKKINQIAKKNKVLLNPSFRIVDLCNIKNISRKIYSISIRGN